LAHLIAELHPRPATPTSCASKSTARLGCCRSNVRTMTDLSTLDATAQAELVRRGEASPLELVDAAIDRIDKLNSELNAVIHPLYERARTAARAPSDGPFKVSRSS
jgi:hypothetical protein